MKYTSESLEKKLAEAIDYKIKFNGSPALLLELVEEIQCLDLPQIKKAWDEALNLLPSDAYWPDHICAAMIARNIAKETGLEELIINGLQKAVDEKVVESPAHAYSKLASYLASRSGASAADRERAAQMLTRAVGFCSQEESEDIVTVYRDARKVELVMDNGDGLAQKLYNSFFASISDLKSAKKIKKSADKALGL